MDSILEYVLMYLGVKLKTAGDLMLVEKKIPFVYEGQIMKSALKTLNLKGNWRSTPPGFTKNHICLENIFLSSK